jgi:Transposase DDE domain group 1
VAYPMGEARLEPLRVGFDRRIKLEFHGARITSDGGLLAYRELDDAFGLTDAAITQLLDGRRGKNGRHTLGGLFRQSVFGRLAGYEDVNDAERLAGDPAMRAIVGREGLDRAAASSTQMGRFETEWLATEANVKALTDLSGAWIDRVHERKPPRTIILDMDSSESPTHGEQEGAVWNGHFGCTCYHPLFVFNQFGDLERCRLRPGNVHSAEDWRLALERVVGFIVTNLTRSNKRVLKFYNGRGAAGQHIKEGKNAIRWTRLSCNAFRHNAVRLQLHALAYDVADFLRTLALPEEVEQWSLTTLAREAGEDRRGSCATGATSRSRCRGRCSPKSCVESIGCGHGCRHSRHEHREQPSMATRLARCAHDRPRVGRLTCSHGAGLSLLVAGKGQTGRFSLDHTNRS